MEKGYVKPNLEVIELRPEERLATCPTKAIKLKPAKPKHSFGFAWLAWLMWLLSGGSYTGPDNGCGS